MTKLNRAAIVADYQKKWDAMRITRPEAVDAAAKLIVANWPAYKAVEAKTGVPAYFIGILHMRECNNNMKGCLHNGQIIIGTKRKTTIVPKGRGPFATFEDSALDALRMQGFLKVKDWSPAVCCYEGEAFNGFGYRSRGVPSPYVLGATQFYARGKYVRDGVYSARVVDPQLGIMPVMKRVLELAPADKAKWFQSRKPVVIPAADPPKPAAPALPKEKQTEVVNNSRRLKTAERTSNLIELVMAAIAAVVVIAQQVAAFVTDWRTLAILALLSGMWVFIKWQKSQSLREAAEGRYVPSKAVTP